MELVKTPSAALSGKAHYILYFLNKFAIQMAFIAQFQNLGNKILIIKLQ